MVFKRKTTISNHVLQILTDSSHALSITQIVDEMKSVELFPNRTTLYRILDKLVQKKMANMVTLNNGTSYFELSKNTHHHHFFCTNCHTLFCLEACHVDHYKIDLNAFLPNKQFEITSHDFNLYGSCAPCSK